MDRLWERNRELRATEALLVDVRAGRGRMLLFQGPAGIGKSALLRHAARSADDAAITTLSAAGAELEATFPFGVARQLLERTVLGGSEDNRARLFKHAAGLAAPVFGLERPHGLLPPTDAEQAAFMGLYWLMVGLAEERPLLLVVDDLQWADSPSVAWLKYAVRRLAGLRVGVIAARRPAEPVGRASVPSAFHEPEAEVIAVEPLSAGGVGALLVDALGIEPGADFRRACQQATKGNPFLVLEITRALRARAPSEPPDARDIEHVRSQRLTSFVHARLAGLPPEAALLARAAAILDSGAELRHAAALAGVGVARAATEVDMLRAADILSCGDRVEFAHPIVRRVVYDAIPAGQRGQWHGRAARMFADEHASAERTAGHLLHSEPTADRRVVCQLREAARDALARGAPSSAARLLSRALREGVPQERGRLLFELGLVESRLHEAAAASHLEEARALATDTRVRAEVSLALTRALVATGRAADAFSLLETEIPEASRVDRDLAMRMEAALCSTARVAPGWAERVADRVTRLPDDLAGATPGERALLGCLAGEAACRGTSAQLAVTLAERALRGGHLLAQETPESPAVYHACIALTSSDSYALARHHVEAALADARARGTPLGAAQALTWRAEIAYRQGALRDAEADAAFALDLARHHGEMVTRPLAVAWLVLSLIEQDRAGEANAILADEGFAGRLPEFGLYAVPAYARGRLRLHLHEPRAALEDLGASLRVTEQLAASNPALLPIRSGAAEAHAAAGHLSAARALADEELRAAERYGAPRAVGIALRTRALVSDRGGRIDLLEHAAELLESAEARLVHAQALCDLGVAVRQRGSSKAAREHLRRALDLAAVCGASGLVQRVHRELMIAGGRPRRVRLSGHDALTPAERRVAALAADGMTNREIAQSLFVTLKTVESHLSRVFHKLDVQSRHKLAAALSEGPQEEQ